MVTRGTGFLALVILWLAAGLPTAGQQAVEISSRNANYTIQVRLHPETKMLEGREVLEWQNTTRFSTSELWFHLYWNAWRNSRSTWLRENALRTEPRGGLLPQRRPEDWGYVQVEAVRVLPGGPFGTAELTQQVRYESPDDANPEDRTVLVAPLPRPVGPGETIRVELIWKSKIPRTFARTGFRGNYFFLAHWFPKLGVFEPEGTWNNHQFHAATEFYADYGVYDVQITVPQGWLVGATGVALGVTENPDGTATHRFQQADVHDFAWTTSPDFREARRRFERSGLPAVDIRLLYQPEHAGQVERHFRAVEAALEHYGLWFGPYPYGHVTVIDPAYESGSGGMEYPTLFTCGTRYWAPFGGGQPEGVTIHEAGHQFWYGLVGNNEFEHAWIDEGLNTFSEERVAEVAYGQWFFVRRFFREFVPVWLRDVRRSRLHGMGLDRYRAAARSDVPATPTYRYHPETASAITYSKTALWLTTLERMLGWEMLQRILATFFERYRFRHPKPEDFFRTASEVAGQDLSWFFDQVFYRAAVFDYAVESVESEPVRTLGYVERNGTLILAGAESGQKEGPYETRVVVRRLQDGILPVEVLFVFEDGERIRETWDGHALWKLYTFTRPARLEYAVIDPERKIVLDVHYTNNSRRLQPRPRFVATKWAAKWMIWLQDFLHTLTFLF